MSYRAAEALQTAIYRTLSEDAQIVDLVGDAIFDAMPVTAPDGPYISLGPEEAKDASDASGAGAMHEFVVSVLSGSDQSTGFKAVKAVAVAVSDVLESATLTLDRGAVVALWFLKARARRVENGQSRRVDMTFRARIDLG